MKRTIRILGERRLKERKRVPDLVDSLIGIDSTVEMAQWSIKKTPDAAPLASLAKTIYGSRSKPRIQGGRMIHLKTVHLLAEQFPVQDRYPFNLPVFQKTGRLDFSTPVTFFVGENGSGKSTLLQALTRKCNIMIWHGEKRPRATYNPYEEDFFRYIAIEWATGSVPGSFFSSQIFQNFARILDEWASTDPGLLEYFGGKSLLTLSHGQSLMAFFTSRFKIKGLYFLDEPETALSPSSQLDLLQLLVKMGRAGHAQFVIATHSPMLLACPGASIYSFQRDRICLVEYEQTEHYRVYKRFMSNPAAYLSEI
jgi:predicted ATPase